MSLELTDVKMERGMLLLAPWKDDLALWCVANVTATKATLIAHFTSFHAEVKTTTNMVPADWRVITQEQAVVALQEALDA